MKTLLTFVFGLISCNLYSQRMCIENISNYQLHQIYNDLIEYNKYNINEIGLLGTTLAKHDSLLNIRRVLVYYGAFTTGCTKCLYHNFGFETYDFAPNDITFETVDSFVNAYNKVMQSILPRDQLSKLNGFNYSADSIFTLNKATLNKCTAERMNDSLINFKIQNESLEKLFKADIDKLKVGIGNFSNDSLLEDCSYSEIKNIGVQIYMKSQETRKIYFSYNFVNMPNRPDICWCELLDKKYIFIIPITIK